MPSPLPGYLHQRLSGEIYAQLREALAPCHACQALYEIDVQFSEHIVVRPDLIVICHEPEGDWITRAPELIFEIVSPRTARRRDWEDLAKAKRGQGGHPLNKVHG